jgi:hypothetical protein
MRIVGSQKNEESVLTGFAQNNSRSILTRVRDIGRAYSSLDASLILTGSDEQFD